MHATICCKPTAEGEWKPYSDRCCAPTDIPDAGSPLRVGPITPLLAQERGSWCGDRTIFRSNSEDGLVVACTASGTMPSELRRACYRPRGLNYRLMPRATAGRDETWWPHVDGECACCCGEMAYGLNCV